MILLKILLRCALLAIILAGFVFSLSLLFYFTPESSNLLADRQVQNSSASLIKNVFVFPTQERVGFGLPVRLKIPGINVDAALEHVGLTPKGTVDVPKGRTNAAWFDLGPRPGDNGNAVVIGHYGFWKNGASAVFNNLYKLQKGDKLYIEDDKGVIIPFVVRGSRSYDPNADASDVFGSNDGRSHLNLITCEGVWDKVSKSYSQRLVVFTDKEME